MRRYTARQEMSFWAFVARYHPNKAERRQAHSKALGALSTYIYGDEK